MENRQLKRGIVIFIYLVLFSLVIWAVYAHYFPKATCSDGAKNQNEEDVDCGGVCAPCKKITADNLIVADKGIVESGRAGNFDFWTLVSNPNNSFGAKSFQYKIEFKDASGKVVAQKEGSSFILPKEEKYIIETNLASDITPSKADFSILKTEWSEFNSYYEKPQLKIVNKNYDQISSGSGFSTATGLLKNESPFDFNVIRIQVLLEDDQNKIIALNSTEMMTVKSGEEREFKVSWPSRFTGVVANMITQADVNVFNSDSFLKRYFKTQDFQRYE